jgi:hypothetical protein
MSRLYDGDPTEWQDFERDVEDKLATKSLSWTTHLPGTASHRPQQVTPEALEEFIVGDDGQEILVTHRIRMQHEDACKKVVYYNQKLEEDCGKACQEIYSLLSPDALLVVKNTRYNRNLTSRDKVMVLMIQLKERYVGNTAATRESIQNKFTKLPQIFDRISAAAVVATMDDLNLQLAGMMNPANQLLDNHFVKIDSDLVQIYMKLLIAEDFKDSIVYLNRELQSNRLTWAALKIEIDFRCTKLGRDEKNDPQDAIRKLSTEARSPIGHGRYEPDTLADGPEARREKLQYAADMMAEWRKGKEAGIKESQSISHSGRDASRSRGRFHQSSDRERSQDRSRGDDRIRDDRSRGDNRGRYDDHQSDRRRSSSYRGNSGDRYVREESRGRDYSRGRDHDRDHRRRRDDSQGREGGYRRSEDTRHETRYQRDAPSAGDRKRRT